MIHKLNVVRTNQKAIVRTDGETVVRTDGSHGSPIVRTAVQTERLNVRLDASTEALLSQLCTDTGKNKSTIIRDAIKLYTSERARKLAEFERELEK